MDLPNYDFRKHTVREAFPVGNKIVYFGSEVKNSTFVLEREGESEQLRVVREEKGFGLVRGNYNTASRVVKLEIYAFKARNYRKVYRYGLETGTWSLFYSY